jgi:hypothetical protein
VTRRWQRIAWCTLLATATLSTTYPGIAWFERAQVERAVARARFTRDQEQLREAALRHESGPAPAARGLRLPDGPDVASVMSELQSACDELGVALERILAPASTVPGLQEYELSGRGELAAVCRLLARIEAGPRPILFEELQLGPADEEQVRFGLVLAAFHAAEGPR